MAWELKKAVKDHVLSFEFNNEDGVVLFNLEVDPADDRIWIIPQAEALAAMDKAASGEAVRNFAEQLKIFGGKQLIDTSKLNPELRDMLRAEGFASPKDSDHEGVRHVAQISVDILLAALASKFPAGSNPFAAYAFKSDASVMAEANNDRFIILMRSSGFRETKIASYEARKEQLLAFAHNAIPMALYAPDGKMIAFCRAGWVDKATGHAHLGDTLVDEAYFGGGAKGKAVGTAYLYVQAMKHLQIAGVKQLSLIVPKGREAEFAALGSPPPSDDKLMGRFTDSTELLNISLLHDAHVLVAEQVATALKPKVADVYATTAAMGGSGAAGGAGGTPGLPPGLG